MSYGLEFTEEFFGDPHIERRWDVEEPESIAEALAAMPEEEWGVMCRDLFPDDPENIGVAEVLEMVRRTNTCSNLDTPVDVWIDENGYHIVRVW